MRSRRIIVNYTKFSLQLTIFRMYSSASFGLLSWTRFATSDSDKVRKVCKKEIKVNNVTLYFRLVALVVLI